MKMPEETVIRISSRSAGKMFYLERLTAKQRETIKELRQRLEQAEQDIKHLLIISYNQSSCAYCKCYPNKCDQCETDAEWRGAEEGTE